MDDELLLFLERGYVFVGQCSPEAVVHFVELVIVKTRTGPLNNRAVDDESLNL